MQDSRKRHAAMLEATRQIIAARNAAEEFQQAAEPASPPVMACVCRWLEWAPINTTININNYREVDDYAVSSRQCNSEGK